MDPIFPGDIVNFECTFHECKHRHDGSTSHVGQVMAVYRGRRQRTRDLGITDCTTNNVVDQAQEGDIVLVIARVLRGSLIKKIVNDHKIIKTNPTDDDVADDEWVLSYDPTEFVPPFKVRRRRDDIRFDYAFGSKVSFPDDPRERVGLPLIRRVFLQERGAFMPPCLIPPVPGALEVTQFGRNSLIGKFVLANKAGFDPSHA